MIEEFTKAWFANKDSVRAKFAEKHPASYIEVVRAVVGMLANAGCDPDPERVQEFDNGDYQGTLVFVIGAKGYQPDRYWYVKVGYGSCSGCDTLQAISHYSDDPPTEEQLNDYMTLALHIVQELREMEGVTVYG